LTRSRGNRGLIAVSVFHEGFAIQSLGSADFEYVAAVAEDLLRAGIHITADMEMGGLSQMILETPEGKLIIAPYGDLSICILAKPDANLGLIRLSIPGDAGQPRVRGGTVPALPPTPGEPHQRCMQGLFTADPVRTLFYRAAGYHGACVSAPGSLAPNS